MSKVIKGVRPSPWPNVARQLLKEGAMTMNDKGLSICAKIAGATHPSESQVNALHAIAWKIGVTIEQDD